tara:strand:- start:127 stop:657 length:531 start_codon:yes stop_codon:yes gene_type:complete
MKKETIIRIIPLTLLLIIFGFFLYYLLQDKTPGVPPSALLKEKMPTFEIIDLFDKDYKYKNDILVGKKTLVNFFASWCSPCKAEHLFLMEINKNFPDLFLLGINYKDKKEDAMDFINSLGNPYDRIGIDDKGSIAMDFGVYGLPETFIINEEGIIIFKHVGPITKDLYNDQIKKLL